MSTSYLRHFDVTTNPELLDRGIDPYVELDEGERVVSVESLEQPNGFVTFRVWIESDGS